MTTGIYFAIIFKIIGSLALLIYGMKVMSEALQKMAGSQLRHILGAMTTNRFTGMLTGNIYNLCCTIVFGNNGNDCFFRKCRAINPCSSYFRDNGC